MSKTSDKDKEIEILKTEVVSLKIRIKRIESFLSTFPNPEDYFSYPPEDDDELFDKAVNEIKEYDRASASLIQRRLSIGYARAARLLDLLEEKCLIGPADGSKPRDVFLDKIEEYLKKKEK